MSEESGSEERRGCSGLENPQEPLRCVFSSLRSIQVGTGTTAKKQLTKLLWYVKQRTECDYGVRKINPQFVPVGDEELIDQDELMENYTPEVEIHNAQVEPAMQALKKNLAKGDKHRKNGETLSAEMEYEKALDVDETNVRAIFGLGLVYLERNDKENSRAVFDQLVDMKGAFSQNHKHLFNEFGIRLRKSELFDEAIQYYARAVELTQPDENLHYNLARAYYEKGDWSSCLEFIGRALEQSRDHKAALSMCKFISAAAEDESLRERHGKPPVPDDVASRAMELLKGDVEEFVGEMVELGPAGLRGEEFADLNRPPSDEGGD